MKQILFIINPVSARGATLRTWTDARRELAALGVDFEEHVTTYADEATAITREALSAGVARVVAVGGDGTLSEVVNGYFDGCGRAINEAAAIGLLPSGTGSDFYRSLGLTSSSDSIRVVTGSETRVMDAARAEFHNKLGESVSRVFINIASFGLGGDVSALVNRWRNSLPRWIGGRARFAAAAVVALKRYRNVPVSIRIDDSPEIKARSNLIIVANGKFAGGGMRLAPNAELDDGLLDVIVTDDASRFDVIKELPRIQQGRYLKNPKVTTFRASAVSVSSEESLPIDLDGEMVGFTPARIRVLPATVRFLG